jgi:hypothetical protein
MESSLKTINNVPFPFSFDTQINPHLRSFSQEEIWCIIRELVESAETANPKYENFAMSINKELIDYGKEVFVKTNKQSLDTFLESLNNLCGDNFIVYFSGWNKFIKTKEVKNFEDRIKDAYDLDKNGLENVDFEFFIGKYPETFGGVHRERCANIQYVYHGQKKFLVWPPSFFENHQLKEKNNKHSNYQREDYLCNAPSSAEIARGVNLEASPYQAFYIPYHWWHVGISPNLSASLTIAFYD